MADSTQPTGAGPAINTPIESGKFDEKEGLAHNPAAKPKVADEEEEDEDIDALIEDLESVDGHGDLEEEEEEAGPGAARVIPEVRNNRHMIPC